MPTQISEEIKTVSTSIQLFSIAVSMCNNFKSFEFRILEANSLGVLSECICLSMCLFWFFFDLAVEFGIFMTDCNTLSE